MQNYWQQIRFILTRLSGVYLLYFLSRWVFFLLNRQAFQGIGASEFITYSWYGLVFDTFSILIANSLFIFLALLPFSFFYKRQYQTLLKVVFLVPNILFLLLNSIDFAYYGFTKKRSTYDLFMQVGGQTDVLALIPSFVKDFWYVLVLFILLIWGLVKWYKPVKEQMKTVYVYTLKQTVLYLLTFLFCIGLCVLGIRGGFGRVPISPVDAGKYGEPGHADVLFNTPFTIIKSFETEKLARLNYYPASQLTQWCNPFHKSDTSTFTGENVVVIILESFGKEYTALSGKESYTPFLDSLMQNSLVYTNAFANASKSIEGIPAILSAMPGLMENPYINSPYCNNTLNSMASLLKQKKYQTAFFHGGFNGTMNFDAYARGAGYDEYYGKNEYANDSDFDGAWGIWDEPFLQFAVKKMTAFQRPFHSAIFTLSSHHPYKIPPQYQGLFKKGKYENHACIQYADYALKRFFEAARQTPWYKNTLFVITADHTSLSDVPYYSNYPGALCIPVLFYRPDNSLKAKNNHLFQQIDILAKVMSLTGTGLPYYSIGNQGISLFYYAGNYYCCDDSLCYTFGNDKINRITNYVRDSVHGYNLLDRYPGLQQQKEQKIKAVLQTFNNHLLDNTMQTR